MEVSTIRRYDNKKPQKKEEAIINENIRAKEVLLIDGEGKTTMATKDAIKLAYERDLDLVLVAATAKPPVCKIMDYSKYRFEQQKKAKEAAKKQRESIVQMKEVRLSPVIDIGDFNTQLNKGRKFLERGDKLKVSLRFRGRAITRKENGEKILKDFLAATEDIATIEGKISMDGRQMFMILKSNNAK